jgi:hypothetical protein
MLLILKMLMLLRLGFCYDLNKPKPMIQTLKEGLTNVWYMHLLHYGSIIRQ